ncbi:phosphatidylglycerophosphatase A [Candidatus Puniceispirillum sp.]|nr:phosphatidylglycerophosphatase A [Candidatus Puniceispirillum sp.]
MTGSHFDTSLAYIATLGPFGKFRPAPGTFGSVIAVIIGYVIASFGAEILAAATIIIIILGTMAADAYGRITQRKDAPEVIIDEVAGQWITLIILPLDPWWFAAGFFLFRLFDITKVGPVGMAERLSGGVGVMADDIVAGILSAICLFCAALIMGKTTLLNFM